MKNLLFILIFLFISLEIISQNKWIEGSILSNEDIEIRGLINDKGWLKSPEFIEFKTNPQDTIQILSPKDIKSFKTKDIYYISRTLNILDAQVEIDLLPKTSKPKFVNKSIFLQVLIESKLSLYYHHDQNFKEHFFVQRDSGKIDELIHYKYIIEGKNILMHNNKYIGQLKYLFSDCNEIKGIEKSISYSRNSISRKVKKYNKCVGFENHLYNTNNIKPEFSIKGGITYSSVVFQSGNNTPLENNFRNTKYSYSLDPTLAITGDFILPFWNNHVAAYADLNYFTYSINGNGFYEDILFDWEFDNEINASYLGTTVGLKYFYPLKKFKLFIGIGMANSFVLDFYSKVITEQIFSPTLSNTSESELFRDYRKYASGITIEPGVEYKNYVLQFKYTRDNAMSDLIAVKSNTNSFGVLIGYKF